MAKKPRTVKPADADYRLNLTLDPEVWVALDAWRKREPDLPTRLHAIRRILDDALRPKRGKQ